MSLECESAESFCRRCLLSGAHVTDGGFVSFVCSSARRCLLRVQVLDVSGTPKQLTQLMLTRQDGDHWSCCCGG